MNDLPVSPVLTGNTQQPAPPQSGSTYGGNAIGATNKEIGIAGAEKTTILRDISGSEVELPKEVTSAGVRIHPTSVPIPAPVANLGVKPLGQNVQAVKMPPIAMPLSDDQIAFGLHQSVTSSWRWLSEWCLKRMKQLHIAFTVVHGKLVRGNG